jgi:integrase
MRRYIRIRTTDPRELQEWLGHADVLTTQIYMHHKPRADAARRLSAAFAVDVQPRPELRESLPAPKSMRA